MASHGRRFEIQGTVQGVGFRPWIYRLAVRHDLTGWVRNDGAGVTIEVFGDPAALGDFERELRSDPPPAARLETIAVSIVDGAPPPHFDIAHSSPSGDRRVSIPPDLATCPECLAEIFSPNDRRYRYPFTNCTNCGPRFTIARRVPYDRPFTTMAAFTMCERCQTEYDDPANRRFHAQPNACPACGPRLRLCLPDGSALDVPDPIEHAAAALGNGSVVGVKGLGGFHLACDATNATAVAALRHRKRRDEKPFAVMVATLTDACAIAALNDDERRLLESVERPIVIVSRHEAGGLAANVAPGNPTVGLMLPYTPLHHLLLRSAGRPLVMTSGNVSDEPIAYDNADAVARLGACVDLFLMHDRDIDTRCDDSVARIIAGRPVVFRRSRGYTPRQVRVPFRFAQPTLAVGALLKNTFCLGIGDAAYLGPHIGDLENLDTYESFEHAVERMLDFVGIQPDVIASDRHPEYLSTRYATSRTSGLHVAVQHHHAHIASAMAERGVTGAAIGVAFDGTGFGPDGTAWGGEFLLVDGAASTRVATCRSISLAGGDVAIRQVWRQALAVLLDAFDGNVDLDQFPVFSQIADADLIVVRRLLETGFNTTRARGIGRYFDAAGALGLGRPVSRYEGQVALDWNLVASPAETSGYPHAIAEDGDCLVVDFRPAFRALVRDVTRGTPAPLVSARFHNTLADATTIVVRRLRTRLGRLPVVLSGGCFQNARLTETIVAMLGSAVQVVLHQSVPPGDGGLALGQAAVACAVASAGGPSTSEGLCA
ncbi:MAG: carbamoyltransferase HypF [Vicinamibacterales bacterium]|nr:carbamoyltransferase HypF [Vicinamibacterales bacterium]